jgi:hypothetical protein
MLGVRFVSCEPDPQEAHEHGAANRLDGLRHDHGPEGGLQLEQVPERGAREVREYGLDQTPTASQREPAQAYARPFGQERVLEVIINM